MNLDMFFYARSIAIIGASREPGKIGNVIMTQLIGKNFKLYPINPNADEILGHKAYKSVLEVSEKIELAVIATPAPTVPGILEECGKKEIKHAIIISAGFKETGNIELEKKLIDALKKNKISCIGPNCLGVFDAHTKLDTLFLPKERLRRPRPGVISFISQSGATGSAILDLAAYENYGFAKFISYGNAANVDESDLLEHLSKDPDTKVICMYVEGIKDGRKFLQAAKKCKKPIIAIKGGVTSAGSKAALSHTGSMAGEAEVYYGAFKQAGIVTAHSLEELFEYAKLFEQEQKQAKGKRVQVITNGGGYGILSADAIEKYNLKLASPGKTILNLKKVFPQSVIVSNPFDVLGDADNERYKLALNAAINDENNDSILVVVLTQTPLIDDGIVSIISEAYQKSQKPIVLVTTGSEYSAELKKRFEHQKIPCFTFPENAIRALAEYVKRR